MNVCSKYPCGMTGGGCFDPQCPSKGYPVGVPTQIFPLPSYTPPPMGCICPPTSEQTCGNPMCPRKNHLSAAGPMSTSNGTHTSGERTDG